MKTIVAGSRGITDYYDVAYAIGCAEVVTGIEITEVVSGTARGVDEAGEAYARRHRLPIKRFKPDWEGIGHKRAGFLRNIEMADYADALIAVWDGGSGGTEHMIKVARQRGLLVHVEIIT